MAVLNWHPILHSVFLVCVCLDGAAALQMCFPVLAALNVWVMFRKAASSGGKTRD